MKNLLFILCLAVFLAPFSFGATPKDAGILPASFNGWQKDGAKNVISSDPAAADRADTAVLKEYGFSDAELATYTRDERKLPVKAARFNDDSRSYGAFTYYEQPQHS